MHVLRPSAFRVVLLLTTAALAALLVPAATAGAAPGSKPYEVTLTPATVTAGVTVSAYTVTLTNRTGTQQFGSANVTVPSAFTIVAAPTTSRGDVSAADHVLQLRNLSMPPNEAVTVTFGLRTTCVSGGYVWGVTAKQSNDFNGPPGNNIGPVIGAPATLTTTVTGSCRLRFVPKPSPDTVGGQPADAGKSEQIRADAFQPASPNLVSVEAVDGRANPQRLAWFTEPISIRLAPTTYLGRLTPNTATISASAGVVSFPDLAIDASGIYNLRATTTPGSGVTGTDSDPFQIIEVTADCNPGQCRALLTGQKTSSDVTGAPGTDTGLLLLSRNLGPEPVCAGYTPPPTGEWYEFRLFSAVRAMTVLASYGRSAMKTFGPPSSLEICFASPHSFITKSGLGAQPFDYDGNPANGAEGFVGLLPNCPQTNNPCVDKRSGTDGALVTFLVPAAWSDPRYH